ncbi:MAG: hypothetical protein WDO56_06680 [Gammaproteobacteria bacterium]
MNRPSPMERRKPRTGLLALLAAVPAVLGACAPAFAVEYQVHGYAAQGFVYSSDNNIFGDSSSGSWDYYEAGLNGSVQVRPNLIFSAQAAIRDAGISDDGSLRLDYALADYRFVESVDSAAGMRVGKIKNPLGFYNETRDVVFSRPTILLPTVYNDNQNQRSLVFSAPGAQLYGSHVWGRNDLSFTGTILADHDVRKTDERLLIDLGGLPFDLHIQDSWNAQIMDSLDGGRWQFALSHFFGTFTLRTPDPIGVAGTFDVSVTVASARYNAEKFTVTAEYALNPNTNVVTVGGAPYLRQHLVADTGYVQGEYRINSSWGAVARVEATYRDRHDRDGSEFVAANPGADRKTRMARDFVVGANWRYGDHWGIWGEYHWIDGTEWLQALENPQPRKSRWSLVMFMAGYKF